MKRIIKFFKKYTNPKLVKISMFVFFISIFIIDNQWFGRGHLTQVTDGVGMIDMNILNSVNGIYNQLRSMGIEGRIIYLNLLKLDYFLIVTLGFFQIVSLLSLVENTKVSSKWEYLIVLPISRGVFDCIENVLLFNSTLMYPSKNVLLLNVIAILIFVKWIAFWITIGALLGLLVVNINKLIKKRRDKIMVNGIKIVSITTSARKNGLGRELVEHALKGAEKSGAKVENINLYESNLEFCTGCLKCMESGKCGLNDNFEMIKNKLHDADGIILCSPTYCGTYNAVMKNFIDRLGLFEHLTSSLGEKYTLSISTAGNKRAAQQTAIIMSRLLTRGTFARGYNSGVMGGSSRPGDDIISERIEIKQRSIIEAEKLGAKLVRDIKNKKKYKFQNIFSRLLSRFVLRPIYVKVITKSKDKNTKAVYNNLISRNII